MWTIDKPEPVKLIIGILAAAADCLDAAAIAITAEFGPADLISDIWNFTQTDYYRDQTGEHILRRFVTIDKLIDPSELPAIKLKTNDIEQAFVGKFAVDLPRPVNLDPGIIEPSKLVLASTKNFSHRIYIGGNIYAEVTLTFSKGCWIPFAHTYPDYRQKCYHDFFNTVRQRLLEQTKASKRDISHK
jgi:hypothetical protein